MSDTTMRELLEDVGIDTDELTHPRKVTAEMVREADAVEIVAYTPTREGYEVVEWEAELLPHDAKPFEENSISWPAEEIKYVLKWAKDSITGAPKAEAIGYDDTFADFYEDHQAPDALDRLVANVRGRSDDWTQVRLKP